MDNSGGKTSPPLRTLRIRVGDPARPCWVRFGWQDRGAVSEVRERPRSLSRVHREGHPSGLAAVRLVQRRKAHPGTGLHRHRGCRWRALRARPRAVPGQGRWKEWGPPRLAEVSPRHPSGHDARRDDSTGRLVGPDDHGLLGFGSESDAADVLTSKHGERPSRLCKRAAPRVVRSSGDAARVFSLWGRRAWR